MNRIRELIMRNDKFKKALAIGVLVIVAFAVFAFQQESRGAELAYEEGGEVIASESVSEENAGEIYVDIGGAVNNPMLARLPAGSRVENAIEAAGGITDNADMTSINRAEFVEDGQKIFIPELMTDDEGNVVSTSAEEFSGKVNINSADSSQLETLTGVGPSTAQKIIDYRNQNGRFSKIEDLKNVSGIGDKTFEKLKDDITI
ncbi:MAG: helix-hairpin-helix domain-containing protein [Firmicutes bacterium]|nr:helix-hairpin-helix domain-containing protein [Bacillota bacterium]